MQENKYKVAAQSLGGIVETSLKQNVTMDVYEEYFAGASVDHSSEPPSAKGLGKGFCCSCCEVVGLSMRVLLSLVVCLCECLPSRCCAAVFRDPNSVKRTATSIHWHPEGNRIAVAYSVLAFQVGSLAFVTTNVVVSLFSRDGRMFLLLCARTSG